MPSVFCYPGGPKPQYELADGTPAVGYKLFTYVAGSVNTKQSTYTDSTGASANTNPIVLNSLGNPPNEIWLQAGLAYKFVLAPSTDTDPPTSPVWSIDNLRGINDTTVSASEWVAGPTATYVSGTSFTLSGDQTSIFTVNRRVQVVDAGGTKYGTISASTYAAGLTTVVVTQDGSNYANPIASVSYGLLGSTNVSVPQLVSAGTGISVTYAAGKPTVASTLVLPQLNKQVYTSGSGNFTTPAGTTTSTVYKITVVGGGGGGGGAATAGANNAGAGGGGGGTAIYWGSGLAAGSTVAYSVGAGGTAGTNAGTAGGTGGTSTVTFNATTISAAGGTGGGGQNVAQSINVGGPGGGATNGTVNINGQAGGCSAGSQAGVYVGGGGGCSTLGGGGLGANGGAGGTGGNYGGGGGGAGQTASAAGGAGAGGVVIIEWAQ